MIDRQLRQESSAARVRRAIEMVEQAPAEALFPKLLETLSGAGAAAERDGAHEAARKIAFAYKLAIELGGKQSILSNERLDNCRRNAARLFGES